MAPVPYANKKRRKKAKKYVFALALAECILAYHDYERNPTDENELAYERARIRVEALENE